MNKIYFCKLASKYPRCEKKARCGDFDICLKTESFGCRYQIEHDMEPEHLKAAKK